MLSGATLRASAMAGTAVFRMVVSSDSMKNATATSQGSRRLAAVVGGGTVGVMEEMQLGRSRNLLHLLEIDFVFFGLFQVGFASFDLDVFFGPFFARVFRQFDFFHGGWFVWVAHTSIRALWKERCDL